MGTLFRPPKIIVTAVFSSLGAFHCKVFIERKGSEPDCISAETSMKVMGGFTPVSIDGRFHKSYGSVPSLVHPGRPEFTQRLRS